MTTNDLPSWLPVFNVVASLTALLLAVPAMRVGWSVAHRAALAISLVILLAGALFQANSLPLWAWIIIGSGGRLAVLALIVAALVVAGPSRRQPQRDSTTLDDIAAQLAEIKRLAAQTSESAERAHVAASVADDRVISQAERAADDRARGIRIEDVSTDTNHRAQDIQERLP